MIAEVIINTTAKQLNKTFDYTIPQELKDELKIGSRILVPFGNKKALEEGFVINIKEKSEYKTKNVVKIQDNPLTEENVKLAKLMSQKYFCNISDCIKLMLPPGTINKNIDDRVKEKTGNFVYLAKDIEEIKLDIQTEKIKSEKQIKLLKFLEENEGIHITDLEIITEVSKSIMKTLEKNGYIEIVKEQIERNPFKNKEVERDSKKVLNQEQKECYEQVKFAINMNEYMEFLLFGVTGARKNRNLYAINRKSYIRK